MIRARHETYDNALAIAFALPSTLEFAEGPMNLGEPAARPVVRDVAIGTAGPIPTKPRNVSGNTLAPIMHDPSRSTLAPPAMNRGS
jgi:hypothetical protein